MRKLARAAALAACAVPALAGCAGPTGATPAAPALPTSHVQVLTAWAQIPGDDNDQGLAMARLVALDGQCYEDVYSHGRDAEIYVPHPCPAATGR